MKTYLLKISALTISVAFVLVWFQNNYHLGLEPQKEKCIPGKTLYIVDKNNKHIEIGDVYEFKAVGMEPWFKAGTNIAKIAQGLPGDVVEVLYDETRVNGKKVSGGIRYLVKHIEKKVPNKTEKDYLRKFIVPDNEYLFLGATDISYDGRFWGTVKKDQIIGKAHGIF